MYAKHGVSTLITRVYYMLMALFSTIIELNVLEMMTYTTVHNLQVYVDQRLLYRQSLCDFLIRVVFQHYFQSIKSG